jgi:AcrR family transcriptional regulator
MAATALERVLDEGPARTRTPLDALRAAREQWAHSGRVDMGALAAELGVSRATLHRWVGTRELLLGEVLWSYAEAALYDARTQALGSGADYLVDVLERYMRSALEFEPLLRFIEQDPQYALRVLASKHSPMQRRSIAAMRNQLAEQVQEGRLEPALELDDLAYLIVRVVESYLYSDVITGSEPDIGKAADAIAVLLHAAPTPRRARTAVARARSSAASASRHARGRRGSGSRPTG